jgi:GT2 family glycosyltransferase
MKNLIDLSVIVVSYNTRALLRDCLHSVYREGSQLNLEVFVVDNHSLDGSREMVERQFPEVQLICNQVNVGYSTANNQALRICRGTFILLLNSDTVVHPGVFDATIAHMQQHRDIGALTCKVMLTTGQLDLACRRTFPTPMVAFWRIVGLSRLFPHSRFFAKYNLTFLDENKTYDVDAVMGAFMLLRRDVFLEVGLLDEQFFMYGEDLDWCYRIRQAGYRIVYYPEVSILHYKGASSNRRRPPNMVKEFHRAMDLFYRKYFEGRQTYLVNALIRFGVKVHYFSELGGSLAYAVRKRFKKQTA